MRGIELAERYYRQVGRPALLRAFPEMEGRWAAGLAGEGSECFGFDDEISRDHDWGPGFCVWLNKEQYEKYGEEMQKVYDSLPVEYMGYRRIRSFMAGKRVGIFQTEKFYEHFLGLSQIPSDPYVWLQLPEMNLAAAVSGRVFEDGEGSFTAFRNSLLKFYPEDVRRKKIAARLAVMAREGQYNYPRCLARKDEVAALQALSRFIEASLSLLYLLKREYAPYYKWAFEGLKRWPEYENYRKQIEALVREPRQEMIEQIAMDVVWDLRMQGLTEAEGCFLQDHGMSVMAGIRDERIRGLHLLAG